MGLPRPANSVKLEGNCARRFRFFLSMVSGVLGSRCHALLLLQINCLCMDFHFLLLSCNTLPTALNIVQTDSYSKRRIAYLQVSSFAYGFKAGNLQSARYQYIGD
jgi:hypothetical protein